jgi:hypothetical protein
MSNNGAKSLFTKMLYVKTNKKHLELLENFLHFLEYFRPDFFVVFGSPFYDLQFFWRVNGQNRPVHHF